LICRRFATVAAALSLAACAGISGVPAESDLQRTWSQAIVALPPLAAPEALMTRMGLPEMADRLGQLPADTKLPVVVYLHGCTGIGNFDLLHRIAQAGFAVVAPDSFARTWRPRQCDPETLTGGYNLFVYDFRLAEVAYALDRLWHAPWADRNRMVLVGSSEGAVAAALYRGDEFRGRVVAQWTCFGAPHVTGISAPPAEPVFALVGAEDPWYTANRGQSCAQFLAGRPTSSSHVVEGAGKPEHEVLAEPAVQQMVVEFLLVVTEK